LNLYRNIRRPIFILIILGLCTVWSLLSQVQILRLAGSETFLGPDGALAFLENYTIDARLHYRGPIKAPIKIIYVDVDSESIRRLGSLPWNREFFALALDALFQHGGVKAAGLDFVFSDAGIPSLGRDEAEKGTRALGKAIHTNKNIVLAATYGSQNRPLGNISSFPFVFERRYGQSEIGPPELPSFPVVGPSWGHIGLIDTVGNDVRYLPFFAKTDLHIYYPMALNLALLHWGLSTNAVKIEKDRMLVMDKDGGVKADIPLVMGQLVEPNWFNAWASEADRHASIVDVIAFGQAAKSGTPEEQELAKKFFEPLRESVALIGPVDPLLKDLSIMPLSGQIPVPRVSVHGNLLKTIASGKFLHRLPQAGNIALIFALGFCASAFSILPDRFSHSAKFLGGVIVLLYIGAAFVLFEHYELLLPIIAPVGTAISCVFAGAFLQLSSQEEQKRRIKGMFGAYLSPALVERMIESGDEPQLGGVDAEITAFFSDVAGFSGFSELLSPQQLVALMNEYLTAMTDILMEQGCYVDKYIGDAIVGMYNAPAPLENHALRACIASQLLRQRLADLRKKWVSEGNKWPSIVGHMHMRIGMNTGFATVGNMGSSRRSSRRFNYTMMGDTVNLAARCESGAKSYGVYTMVTGETRRAAEAAGDDCVFRYLDKIIVKGRSEPTDIHEIVCLRSDLNEETTACMKIYDEGTAHYLAQQWDRAIAAFERSSKLEWNRPALNPDSQDTPSTVMLARALRLKDNPPQGVWTGVYKMETK
jgi:adenylate cyclase